MGTLQLVLLIIGVAGVIAIYFYSRRERKTDARVEPQATRPTPPPAGDAQLNIFGRGSQFDEFGVGQPRRISPQVDSPSANPADGADSATPARKVSPDKIVSLLIAEREGTHIVGEQLHAALQAQGLEFGERQIYHRVDRGADDEGCIVFSVASLFKPGHLNPAEAKGFTTPGLTVFMVLPGPIHPVAAFQDMLATTQALARTLNAEVYDSKRRPLTNLAAHTLQAEVDQFARECMAG